MKHKWGVKYQLVPPDLHRRNAAERAIRTFKSHLLSILAGVATDFPCHLWDLFLLQTKLTLNLLRQSTVDPTIFGLGVFQWPLQPQRNAAETPWNPCNLPLQTIIEKVVGLPWKG